MSGRISFDGFQDWFTDFFMDGPTEPEDQRVANTMMARMSEYLSDHITLEQFKDATRKHLTTSAKVIYLPGSGPALSRNSSMSPMPPVEFVLARANG